MEAKDKRHILKDEYPINLLRAIAEDYNERCGIPLDNITEDIKDGLSHILSSLPEREQEILRLRYQERKSLREIGEIYGTTPNAVRGHESNALRKLRTPPRLGYIKFGKRGFEEYIAERKSEKEKAFNERGLNIPLEELNFTVRAFNNLKKIGCNTVADAIVLSTEQIESIRNLGKKTLIEIATKFEALGAYDTAWSKYLPKEK